jgi:hypothetical protein
VAHQHFVQPWRGACPAGRRSWPDPGPLLRRRCKILRSTLERVRRGLRCGRLDRSTIPATPSCRYRSAQRLAVFTLTWNRSAARRSGQPSFTTHRASFKRPRSVKVALAWGTRTSWVSRELW